MGHFEEIALAPPDAIFDLSRAFREDQRDEKVNLGVGIFRDASLQPTLFAAVKDAEEILAPQGLNRAYLPIDGDQEFLELIAQILFGKGMGKEIYGAQSLGGTGALRLAGDLLKQQVGARKFYLPELTWANHKGIFGAAGLEVGSYPYYDSKGCKLAFEAMLEGIGQLPEGSPLLFHACCHNPSGVDPTLEQWKAIAQVVVQRRLLPIFDCAYQGFGVGLEEDVAGLRHFVEQGIELLVCYSCSKNFGLYAERVGALYVVTGSGDQAERVGSQARKIIRCNYSNPPCHGERVVCTILKSEELRDDWQKELEVMRLRVREMRNALMAGLHAKGGAASFAFLEEQKGMFSFCGLTQEQAQRLTAEYGVYVTRNGRINVTGLNSENLDYVVDAILAVMQGR